MYNNEHYFKIFYGDAPRGDKIHLFPHQRDSYNFLFSPELEDENYSELVNMPRESENKYVLVHPWWKCSKKDDDEESTYEEDSDKN
eukprot:12030823-Ditylum_brightwellii.AAC.1